MRKLIIPFLCLLIAFGASPGVKYEYWFDDLTDNVISGIMVEDSVSFRIATAGLPEGLHYYNIRFLDEKGNGSSLFRRPFYFQKNIVENGVSGVQFWLDDKAGDLSFEDKSHFCLNIEDTEIKVHSLNILPLNQDGLPGTVTTTLFFAASPLKAEIASFRYWFDDDTANLVTVEHRSPVLSAAIDVHSLSAGVHTFNFQPINISGISGPVYSERFDVMAISGLHDPEIQAADKVTVYTLTGICLMKEVNVDRLNELSPGIYIINGVKTLIK